jgi:hypothetical protein
VDSLLASPRFGEKWASWWLDMARYADTKGYEKDNGRNIWRYRDWVIRALNADMPFDQFTIEQLAGDLLPHPNDDQLIATAFHRNTMNNDEGGTDDEEFRVAALIDRVNTTWEIWQSTTMGCVQCHTHPYDPFVNKEYYTSLAVFNNTRDEDTPGEYPNLRMYDEPDQIKLEEIRSWVAARGSEQAAGEMHQFLRTLEPKFHPHDFDRFVNGALLDNKFLGIRPGGSARVAGRVLDGKTQLIMRYWSSEPGGSFEVRLDALDGKVICSGSLGKTNSAAVFDIIPTDGVHDLYFLFDNATLRPDKSVCGVEWFAFRGPLPGATPADVRKKQNIFMQLVNADVERTPIMVENGPEQHRTTRMFVRGNWMVKGDTVTPDVPKSLNSWPDGQPRNRLGFARWLMDPANPLTARAITNRIWEQLFGHGLAETLEDFGTQGAMPSHPELLDWLSNRLQANHEWHLKGMIKDIVMSATYQQDARLSPRGLEDDPDNRLLARGPRVRLTFEQVRDQALEVSGLLNHKMYGKSVMPYQPKGIWNSVYSNEKWVESTGEDRYRRSVYTYAKRTSPYPAMAMFDGASREFCVSRRIPTNTPLQALVTLNDSSFMVASKNLAVRMMNAGDKPSEQIRAGYKLLVVRDIEGQKLAILTNLYDQVLRRYQVSPAGMVPFLETESSPSLAAMTVVANAILNLDEVITKE